MQTEKSSLFRFGSVVKWEAENSFLRLDSWYLQPGCPGSPGSSPRSEVGEAAGILFVLGRDEEDGIVKVIVAELLEGDGGGDGREHGDVQFDGETRRQLHLDELSQLVEVFERSDDLQNVQ